MSNKISPQNIEDLFDNTNTYINEIRQMNNDDKTKTIDELDMFVKHYFENTKLDRIDLIPKASYFVDTLFKEIINMTGYDVNTSGYFGIVLNRIFFNLTEKGVNLFYIIDNALRDDKFVLLMNLFKNAGLDVITPNNVSAENTLENFTDTKPEYTKGQSLDYKTIEKRIDESVNKNRHIVYIEKDDSVNYLSDILKLAEEFQSKYVCVFRNKGADDPTPPQVFMGSFGEMLDK